MVVAAEQLDKHATTAANTNATIELLEAIFYAVRAEDIYMR
jgi:hypothetical protein